jgi:hypothetical protein
MTLDKAQREMRAVYMGGAVGQLVTGLIWLFSAVLATWAGVAPGIAALFFGGMLIFPLTQGALRLLGKRATLSPGNPLAQYPLQSVFAMTALYPLVYAAALYNVNWFYPAAMIVVGAHYVAFIHLYGMWQYGALAAALVGGGVALGLLLPNAFAPGAWVAGLALLAFAAAVWITVVPSLPRTEEGTLSR